MTTDALTEESYLFLRRVLWVDAATCLAMGALLVLFSSPLASLLGLPAPLLTWAGAALFLVAAFMGWVAFRDGLAIAGAWAVIIGNVGWMTGSMLVLFVYSPTGLGIAFVIVQALAVALLAAGEYAAVAKMGAHSAAQSHRLT